MKSCMTQYCSFYDVNSIYSCNRNVADYRPIHQSCQNYTAMKGDKMQYADYKKVILSEEISLDAEALIEPLKDIARSKGVGSGQVDEIEWRAASVIRQLLFERSRGRTIQGAPVHGIAPECNCEEMHLERTGWGSFGSAQLMGIKDDKGGKDVI